MPTSLRLFLSLPQTTFKFQYILEFEIETLLATEMLSRN